MLVFGRLVFAERVDVAKFSEAWVAGEAALTDLAPALPAVHEWAF